MKEQSLQQNPIQQFSYQATCLRGNRVKRICISSASCKGNNIFICGRSDDKCECHFQHRNCPTIAFDCFLDKFTHYKKTLSEEINAYIERFERIYHHLQKKILKELQIFKANYEHLLFGDIKPSIDQKIEAKKFNLISSVEVSQFLNNLELFSQQINCGKLTVNECREIDKKMIELFQLLQNLYKQKITRRLRPSTSQQKNRSFSSTSLQKSFETLESSSHLRKSSMIERPNSIKGGLVNGNYSMMLEKKKPSNIEEIKFDQNVLLRPPKINLDYPKYISSKIIDNCSLINHFIGKQVKNYELDFRASEHNFQVRKFYQILQKLGPIKEKMHQNKPIASLFLIKTEFNNVFGAFTEVPFVSNINTKLSKESADESQNQFEQNPEKTRIKAEKKFCSDIRSSSFLFCVNLQQKYILKNPQKAVYIGSRSLGFGNSDFRIKNKSNTVRQNVCRIGDTYKGRGSSEHISVDYDAKNMKIIGSRYGKKFKISEWQYFRVILDQKT